MSDEVKQGTVVTGVQNTLEIEMKVSKQEVVDMIVQEQEDALDEEIARINKEVKKVRESGQRLVDSFKAAIPKLGSSSDKAKEVVEALNKLYPGQATRIVTSLKFSENVRYNEEKEESEPITAISDEEEKALKTYRDLVDPYSSRYNYFINAVAIVNLYGEGVKPGSSAAISSLPVKADLRSELLALPEFKALAAFGDELNTLNEKLQELQVERSKLASLGKRAKGKIIRQMLESSENGKAILAGTRKIGKLSLTAPKSETTS